MADDLSGDNPALLIAADYLAKSLIVRRSPRLSAAPLVSLPLAAGLIPAARLASLRPASPSPLRIL